MTHHTSDTHQFLPFWGEQTSTIGNDVLPYMYWFSLYNYQ